MVTIGKSLMETANNYVETTNATLKVLLNEAAQRSDSVSPEMTMIFGECLKIVRADQEFIIALAKEVSETRETQKQILDLLKDRKVKTSGDKTDVK